MRSGRRHKRRRTHRKWAGLRACGGPQRGRDLAVETLEPRNLLAALPYGAHPDDTSEVMLGEVLVTLVLMESDGGVDPDTEQWTADARNAVQQTVTEGVEWWEQALAGEESVHQLDFHFDTTYLESPVPTPYEPISRPYDAYQQWVPDFLQHVGFDDRPDLFAGMRAFNHAQRLIHGTDWAFTVFVVNSQQDADNRFAEGAIRGSFAFTGGPFLVMPSRRSAQVAAHETGHIFYALDEYRGGDPHSARSGYYDTQNGNANDDENPDARVNSIMSGSTEMLVAYRDHLVSPAAQEMIGWRDSDSDGIFDISDVPHTLAGTGAYDPESGIYRFVGRSQVATLPNRNPDPASRLSDITLNRIHRAEYRIDGHAWQTAARYDAARIELDLFIPDVPATARQIEIRTVDDSTGVTSPVFAGRIAQPDSVTTPGVAGFAWFDVDQDGVREAGEPGLAGWTVNLSDESGQPLAGSVGVEPDDFPADGTTAINHQTVGVTLTAQTPDSADDRVGVAPSSRAATGSQVFAYRAGTTWRTDFTNDSGALKMEFAVPVANVRLVAIGLGSDSYGRLEVYDAQHRLLGRFTTDALDAGQSTTMSWSRGARDIKYAIARGHAHTAVELDQLRFGADPSATTDPLGAYVIAYLEDGTYQVELVPRDGWTVRTPARAVHTVTVVNAAASGMADFGLLPPRDVAFWQNSSDPEDVDDNGDVSRADFESVVRTLGAFGLRTTPAVSIGPYLDVNGDQRLSLRDARDVMLRLLADPDQTEQDGTDLPAPQGPSARDRVAAANSDRPPVVASPRPAAASDRPSSLAAAEKEVAIAGAWVGKSHEVVRPRTDERPQPDSFSRMTRAKTTPSPTGSRGDLRSADVSGPPSGEDDHDEVLPTGSSRAGQSVELDELVQQFAADVLAAWRRLEW